MLLKKSSFAFAAVSFFALPLFANSTFLPLKGGHAQSKVVSVDGIENLSVTIDTTVGVHANAKASLVTSSPSGGIYITDCVSDFWFPSIMKVKFFNNGNEIAVQDYSFQKKFSSSASKEDTCYLHRWEELKGGMTWVTQVSMVEISKDSALELRLSRTKENFYIPVDFAASWSQGTYQLDSFSAPLTNLRLEWRVCERYYVGGDPMHAGSYTWWCKEEKPNRLDLEFEVK